MSEFSLLSFRPKETLILGRILAGFGDIEYSVALCVGNAISDQTSATRALFRLRGQDVRIETADALMRPAYEKIGLKDQYETALGALRYSKKIRNQYAHAHWLPDKKGGLFFADLEAAAKTARGTLLFTLFHVDEPLLSLQENYLQYTWNWWAHLLGEYQTKAGGSPTHIFQAPKVIEKPPLHNPLAEHPAPRPTKAGEATPPSTPEGGPPV